MQTVGRAHPTGVITMLWIKTHVNLVITIIIGVLGLTGITLGMVMSDVASKMQSDQSTLSTLGSAKGSNENAINEARKNSDQVRAQLEDALKKFESIGNHTPILADVFPK